MLNQVVLVGILKEIPVLKESSNGIKYTNLLIEVKREYRNNEGLHEYDVFNVLVWRNLAEQCVSNCKKDTLIAIKGRLQSSIYKREDASLFYNYECIAEKVFFVNE